MQKLRLRMTPVCHPLLVLLLKYCCSGLRGYEEDVLRFMVDADVPFTNNQGENDIRMTKVQQKIVTRTDTVLPTVHVNSNIKPFLFLHNTKRDIKYELHW